MKSSRAGNEKDGRDGEALPSAKEAFVRVLRALDDIDVKGREPVTSLRLPDRRE